MLYDIVYYCIISYYVYYIISYVMRTGCRVAEDMEWDRRNKKEKKESALESRP